VDSRASKYSSLIFVQGDEYRELASEVMSRLRKNSRTPEYVWVGDRIWVRAMAEALHEVAAGGDFTPEAEAATLARIKARHTFGLAEDEGSWARVNIVRIQKRTEILIWDDSMGFADLQVPIPQP
jgi:hypothetical protein